MTQLIKNLKSWHWGLLFESQRVTWTTFPILAMFLLIHSQFLQKTAPLASIFGASVFVQFWSVELFNGYWDRLRQHFHRTQANHLSDLNIDPILFRRLVCHTRIQLKTFCHCYQEWLVFANSVFFFIKTQKQDNQCNEWKCSSRSDCKHWRRESFASVLSPVWCEDLYYPPFLGLVFTFLLWREELLYMYPFSFIFASTRWHFEKKTSSIEDIEWGDLI